VTIRRGTVGSGLTEKPSVSWNDKADEAKLEIAALIEAGTLDGMIRVTERTCFRLLVDAGLPREHGCYLFKKDTGEWREASPPFGGWSVANTVEPIARAAGFAPDSPVGFAAAILDRIFWLRDNQRRGDHDRAALFAYYVGFLKAESRIKDEHERTWESGRGTREGARIGAAKRTAAFEQRHKEVRSQFAEILTRTGNPQRAKNATAKHFNISRRQLNRILAK
jgi:hypothetical protein